jgi:hypothetical protein
MPTDKLLHFLAGIAMAAILYPFGILPAMLAVTIAAIGKELRDMRGHGTPEVLDALATVAGGAALLGWFEIANGIPFI